MGLIRNYIKKKMFQKKWRKKNAHNSTNAVDLFDIDSVVVGNHTYGSINCLTWGNGNEKVKIGCYCSIARDVMFILNADHFTDTISSFPFKAKLNICGGGREAISKGDIVIEDDVWIGFRSIILSGVTIGQGAIIAAGSVVTRDVPPYSIVGGVPAKIIKKRFNDKIISKLQCIDFKRLTADMVEKNIEKLYAKVSESNVDELISSLPQKEI